MSGEDGRNVFIWWTFSYQLNTFFDNSISVFVVSSIYRVGFSLIQSSFCLHFFYSCASKSKLKYRTWKKKKDRAHHKDIKATRNSLKWCLLLIILCTSCSVDDFYACFHVYKLRCAAFCVLWDCSWDKQLFLSECDAWWTQRLDELNFFWTGGKNSREINFVGFSDSRSFFARKWKIHNL